MPRGDHLRGRHERPVGSGRKAGQVNRTTREMRAIVQMLVDSNADNISLWLARVADGTPTRVEGGIVVERALAPDPAKAVELLLKLAEFVSPRMAPRRQEDGRADEPVTPVVNITLSSNRPVKD